MGNVLIPSRGRGGVQEAAQIWRVVQIYCVFLDLPPGCWRRQCLHMEWQDLVVMVWQSLASTMATVSGGRASA